MVLTLVRPVRTLPRQVCLRWRTWLPGLTIKPIAFARIFLASRPGTGKTGCNKVFRCRPVLLKSEVSII